ncbi:MAG: glutamate--cysteine ligase [Myxococcales bacterium]|nr:glutamate--cysteine ligase [Myxococcales bacterium]
MTGPLGLFAGYGIELEYMIVDAETLDVRPISDEVLKAVEGTYVNEVEVGDVAWSNELVLHVIEMKTNGPAPRLEGLADGFAASARRINEILAPLGARLMPGPMHPWMDPFTQTRLWPHDYDVIYETYNRIFDCRGHGWSNLQSMHVNLPFADDAEFGRLHAAIRLVLPILPALAAGSPIVDGRIAGALDHRLEVYRTNSIRVPSVTGAVVPERVYTRATYEGELLGRIYEDLAPLDPEGVLRDEWVNARGAIARFDRSAIEIRVLDVQECPRADLAIAALIVAVLQALVAERWCDVKTQQAWEIEPLAELFRATSRDAEAAMIADRAYLDAFGWEGAAPCAASDLWRSLRERVMPGDVDAPWREALDVILDRGPLARRLLRATGSAPDRRRLFDVYGALCECLADNGMFLA